MQACEFLLDVFLQEGISHVFLVPGGYIDPIISALKTQPIKGIVAAHEGGAVFMADGYARLSRKFGVAIGIGGPGITNMITGIATAYIDQIPLFIVTGETKTIWEGRGAFQDSSTAGINNTVMLKSITVKKLTVNHIETLQHHIKYLLRAMLNPTQRGPVHLSFPADIQLQQVQSNYKKLSEEFTQPRFVDQHAFNKIWNLVKSKSKIAILAGTGVLHSDANRALLAMAERFDIPVATTLTAKGVFPEDHRLSLGIFGWFGTRRATEVLLSSDIEILIVLGSKLTQMETMAWSTDLLPKHALIINDINSCSWHPNYDPDLFVLGDAREFLQSFLQADEKLTDSLSNTQAERTNWIDKQIHNIPKIYHPENLTSDRSPIHPARIIHELRQSCPRDTILFAGEGAHGFFAGHYWTSYAPSQFFIDIKSMSPMGWSIPAAIGAKFARPEQPVVCITGDGSIMMHGMEIQTAARYNLPMIFVVFNNQAHGNPQLRGRRIGKFECEFLKLPLRDWSKFAESMGAVGLKVRHAADLQDTFNKAWEMKKTVVIDIDSSNCPTPTYALDKYLYHIDATAGATDDEN